jgi:TolB-like protein
MRALLVALAAFLIVGQMALAQPQLAVLRTTCAAGIDPTIGEPITEKIIEAIVQSGKYTVLDRLNIDKVLSEKEFQITSSVVSQAEMRRAGEYLGADFVLLAGISRVGTTFILSAKMVDVTSGAISVQVSEERKGSIDVLLEAASVVGDRVASTGRAATGAAVAKAAPKQGEATVAVEDETAMEKIFGIRSMLDRRYFMKEAGAMEVAARAALLGVDDRAKLYRSYRMVFPVGYGLLNLVPSLGSWVQGDIGGAILELSLFAVPTIITSFFPGGPVEVLYISLTVADSVGLICPFIYGSKYNRMLSRSLLIVDLSPGEGARVAYIDGSSPPSPQAPGLGLTLLRIEL